MLAALHVQLLLVDGNLKNSVTGVGLLDLDLAASIHDEPLAESELYGVHELCERWRRGVLKDVWYCNHKRVRSTCHIISSSGRTLFEPGQTGGGWLVGWAGPRLVLLPLAMRIRARLTITRGGDHVGCLIKAGPFG